MIRVLVVDDSPLMCRVLGKMLESDPGIRVWGTAGSGEEALELLEKGRPDVVTMDIHMGGMDGFETTRRIMESERPLPVVIVSSCWDPLEVERTFEAMAAGAVAILPKPANMAEDGGEYEQELLRTIRAASEARVGRLRKRFPDPGAPLPAAGNGRVKIVAAGASTGGPQALSAFLSGLPAGFPRPVLVVQHMAQGFTRGLADWLGKITPLRVKIGAPGESLSGGTVYIAPEGMHMVLNRSGDSLRFSDNPPLHMVRPSVSVLFRSVAEVFGKDSAALLFSGMGADGAEELKQLRDLGAATFAQDRESSVVWGMPGEAVRLEGAEHVGSPSVLAAILSGMMAGNCNRTEKMDNGERR